MQLSIQFDTCVGKVKPMNAVNNGPIYSPNATSQDSGNLHTYTAAGIPYARTHDASFCASYGGEHTVDITAVFPRFEADPYDPASYDFHLTDEYCQTIQLAGTQVFFRLGQRIEHASKKYGIYPPADFHKWAVICEHLIAHLNEGWADGYHLGIEYWEIWNEPNLVGKCWMGTAEEYYELYAVTARHLKARFPHLKIGGPAVTAYEPAWLEPFLTRVRDENLPMDFYSWHCYGERVGKFTRDVLRHRELLDKYGLHKTESILNEWNYVCGWRGEDWTHSLDVEVSMKGAAFVAAVMTACQTLPLDMLMYYDARPSVMNGLFSFYNYRLLKGYFAIKTWGEMLKMGKSCLVECDVPDIWAMAAVGEKGEKMAMITYYSDDDTAPAKTFTAKLSGISEQVRVFLLDEAHDLKEVGILAACEGKISLTMAVNTVLVLREA